MKRHGVAAVVVVAALAAGGCATTYEPRPGPRIASLDIAGRNYARDGRRYEVGNLGDAEDLVRGNDAAVREARAYRRCALTGWILYGVGVAVLTTSAVVLFTQPEGSGHAAALSLASLPPLVVSMPFLAGSRTKLQNAVNIYNEGLEPPTPSPSAAPTP